MFERLLTAMTRTRRTARAPVVRLHLNAPVPAEGGVNSLAFGLLRGGLREVKRDFFTAFLADLVVDLVRHLVLLGQGRAHHRGAPVPRARRDGRRAHHLHGKVDGAELSGVDDEVATCSGVGELVVPARPVRDPLLIHLQVGTGQASGASEQVRAGDRRNGRVWLNGYMWLNGSSAAWSALDVKAQLKSLL